MEDPTEALYFMALERDRMAEEAEARTAALVTAKRYARIWKGWAKETWKCAFHGDAKLWRNARLRAEAAEARVAVLEAALRDADAALAKDRTGLAGALVAIMKEVEGRLWVRDGRGCYDWDDDRYKAEAGDALCTVMDIAKQAWIESGNLVIPALNAIDAIPGIRVRT